MPRATKVSDIVPRAHLDALRARRDSPGLVFLAGHCATLGLTGALLWAALGTGWVVPATVLHGVVIVHLFAPFHECAHRTAFRSGWLNRAAGWLTGAAILLTPTHFRYEHLAHHAHTQIAGRDPEMIPMAERLGGYLFYATAIPYFQGLFRSLLRHPFGRFSEEARAFVPARELDRVRRETWILWGVYAALAAASLWLQSWALLVYWLLPRFAGEPVMRLIRMTEHAACTRDRDVLRNTRTVLTLAPVRWLAWNMAYHAEHHAAAAIPFFALPALHRAMGARFAEVRKGYFRTQAHLIANARANARRAA